MRKKIFVLLLVCLIGLAGCGSKTTKYDCDGKDVCMKVKESTLSSSGATFLLINNSSISYGYGEPYHIEEYVNDEWKKVEPIEPLAFILPLYELKSNDVKEIEIDWERGYGKLKPGKYRFVKDISSWGDDNSSNQDIYAEFTIE